MQASSADDASFHIAIAAMAAIATKLIQKNGLHQSAYCQAYFCEWKNKLVNVLQAVVCVHRRPNGLSDSFSAAASFLVQAFYLLK